MLTGPAPIMGRGFFGKSLMLVVSYYTLDTPYEAEAKRLERSLQAAGMPYRIHGVQSRGNWYDNTRAKPEILRKFRDEEKGPLFYVDADAWVHRDVTDELAGYGGDFALHHFRNREWLTGTILINDTDGAREGLRRWINVNRIKLQQGQTAGGGQANFATVINADDGPQVSYLPAKYCWIFDLSPRHCEPCDPAIEHLQASRENRKTHLRGSVNAPRQRRIRQLEAQVA